MYGGPCTLQALERKTAYSFLLRLSCEWGEGKVVHRQVRVLIDSETAEVAGSEVVDHEPH